MEEWQIHQKHDEEVKAILKEDKCMDSKNQLRSWHGMRTVNKLKDGGHTDLAWRECICYKTWKEKR